MWPARSPVCRGRIDGDLREGGGVCARRAAATRLRRRAFSRGSLFDFPDRSGRYARPRRLRAQPDDDGRDVLGSVLRRTRYPTGCSRYHLTARGETPKRQDRGQAPAGRRGQGGLAPARDRTQVPVPMHCWRPAGASPLSLPCVPSGWAASPSDFHHGLLSGAYERDIVQKPAAQALVRWSGDALEERHSLQLAQSPSLFERRGEGVNACTHPPSSAGHRPFPGRQPAVDKRAALHDAVIVLLAGRCFHRI